MLSWPRNFARKLLKVVGGSFDYFLGNPEDPLKLTGKFMEGPAPSKKFKKNNFPWCGPLTLIL
jgi:hypothetical protein